MSCAPRWSAMKVMLSVELAESWPSGVVVPMPNLFLVIIVPVAVIKPLVSISPVRAVIVARPPTLKSPPKAIAPATCKVPEAKALPEVSTEKTLAPAEFCRAKMLPVEACLTDKAVAVEVALSAPYPPSYIPKARLSVTVDDGMPS